MKKLFALALTALLTVSMAGTVWADTPDEIGRVTGELPEVFQGKEATLEENCKKAYEWALQLHAQ